MTSAKSIPTRIDRVRSRVNANAGRSSVDGLADPQISGAHVVVARQSAARPGTSPEPWATVKIAGMQHAEIAKALGQNQGFQGLGSKPMLGLSRTTHVAGTTFRRARTGTRARQLPAGSVRRVPPALLPLRRVRSWQLLLRRRLSRGRSATREARGPFTTPELPRRPARSP